jgi:endonuclease G, mitochondrial
MSRDALLALVLVMAALIGGAHAQDATDPERCAAIWQKIGLPRDAGDEATTTTVCHLGYIVGHNDTRKAPNWVIERLTPQLTEGKARRKGLKFAADTALPEDARAVPADYKGNRPFDQGHNAPAADFAGDQQFLNDTFFLSNAVPQVGAGFNRSIWSAFESQVRNLVGPDHGVIYVITGSVWQEAKPIKIDNDVCGTELTLPVVKPVAICPATAGDKSARCQAGVSVPAAMYKIVYDPDMDNAFAVLLQNESHSGRYQRARDYIEAHRVGLATIEDLTGLRFFTALPARKLRQMRDNCVDVRVH